MYRIEHDEIPTETLTARCGNSALNSAKVADLAEAMRAEGWTGPGLFVDDLDQVLDGQHRLAAAVLAGLEDVPVIRLRGGSVDDLERDISDVYDFVQTLEDGATFGVEDIA